MSEPTVYQGARGTLPNPKGFGFSWKPLQKLLTEQQRLWNEHRETDGQYRQLEGQISVMERQEFETLARSYRTGGAEPDGSDIAKARAELEQVKRRAQAQARALELIDADIATAVAKHSEEWRREVHAKAKERAEAVEDAIHRLRSAQAELYAMSALGEWLDRPKQNFAHRDGPSILETFTHRDVRLGEVFDAIRQDAREKAATPEEREQQRWAAMGATATPGVGWVG